MSTRRPQLAYSEIQHKTLDAERRRRKARKIVAVLRHFHGASPLAGLPTLDIGSSTGFTAEALHRAGLDVTGIDIDLPGLAHARAQFGSTAHFLCADGARLPFADRSFDVVVFNHIYEHVVDPDAVMAEISRVLTRDGVVYFAFGNKHQVVEPHYRLPFLSWLPERAADRYVAATGRADDYYERFRTRSDLVRMCGSLHLWDYTATILADPAAFAAEDLLPGPLTMLPGALSRVLQPIMPTFVWIGTPGGRTPAGPPTRSAPRAVERST